VASDIDPAMLDLVRERMGVEVAMSHSVPEQFDPGGSFDLIFALSFFSHMPQATYARWLARLSALLRPAGALLFTAHGHRSAPLIKRDAGADEGFGWDANGEHPTLPGSEYGLTVSPFEFVWPRLQALGDLRLVRFEEGAWWGHQDAYLLLKTSRRRPPSMRDRLRAWRDRRAPAAPPPG